MFYNLFVQKNLNVKYFVSEGQRKANFEEYDAKKRENAQKISDLKKKVKELYMKYAEAKNVRGCRGLSKEKQTTDNFYAN